MIRVFRFDCAQMSLGMAANGQKRTLPSIDFISGDSELGLS